MTIEQLYWKWKRPRTTGDAELDYAWGEDSYSFAAYARLHNFSVDNINNLDIGVKQQIDNADYSERQRIREWLFADKER
jgi:hypothetical protein